MSEKQKRVNPYTSLMERFKEFGQKIAYRHTRLMWTYPAEKLNDHWKLASLKERVVAATQLGYDVVLRENDGALQVFYVKQAPELPWEIRQ